MSCRGCIYRAAPTSGYICDYAVITGRSRGCPIKGCTRKETRGKRPAGSEFTLSRSRIDETKARALYESGKTDGEIAQELGVTASGVQYWRKRRGLPAKISRGRRW